MDIEYATNIPDEGFTSMCDLHSIGVDIENPFIFHCVKFFGDRFVLNAIQQPPVELPITADLQNTFFGEKICV